MTYDTSKDPRILVAHHACGRLKQALQQKLGIRRSMPKERMTALTAAADSAVMTLRYTYQEPADLVKMDAMRDLQEAVQELAVALDPFLTAEEAPPLLRANVAWCLRTLSGLPGRLEGPADSMAAGADLVVVKVSIVSKLGKHNLWRTRVSDGNTEYTVVTNIPGVRPGDTMAVAFLPPREVGGEVSEAMYLGSEKRTEPPGTPLSPTQVDAREAASILHEDL